MIQQLQTDLRSQKPEVLNTVSWSGEHTYSLSGFLAVFTYQGFMAFADKHPLTHVYLLKHAQEKKQNMVQFQTQSAPSRAPFSPLSFCDVYNIKPAHSDQVTAVNIPISW